MSDFLLIEVGDLRPTDRLHRVIDTRDKYFAARQYIFRAGAGPCRHLGFCGLHALIVTGEQLRAARAMARIEQSDLARASKVSVDTIKRLERTIGPVSANVATVNSVVQALESAGIEFIAENGRGPGVRLRKGNHNA
jgi:DNA-binding XRE family transcriptional regulator